MFFMGKKISTPCPLHCPLALYPIGQGVQGTALDPSLRSSSLLFLDPQAGTTFLLTEKEQDGH